MKQCIESVQSRSSVIVTADIKRQKTPPHPQSTIRCCVGKEVGLLEGSLVVHWDIVEFIGLSMASLPFRSQEWFRALPKSHDVKETL